MTEYWVSQSKYWCELCKCWINDTPTARANHEKGTGHKLAVQRKLRELRKNADIEKKAKERTETELAKIEKAAEKAYQKDLDKLVCSYSESTCCTASNTFFVLIASHSSLDDRSCALQDTDAAPLPPPAQPPPQLGKWEKNSQSAYLYNAELRWYYDEKSGFYYGGDPPTWTTAPSIPEAAKYKGAKKSAVSTPLVLCRGIVRIQVSSAMNVPSYASQNYAGVTVIKGKLPEHIANLGGHRAPVEGKLTRGVFGGMQSSSIPSKRLREDAARAAKNPAEAEEIRKREEARERVRKRTASSFGLQ